MLSYDDMETLFVEWKQTKTHAHLNSFIEDGIIDVVRWNTINKKVLFILREAYQPAEIEGGFNLTKKLLLESGTRKGKSTWKNLARWAYLLQNLDTPDLIQPFTRKWFDYEEALLNSAIINIKKSGGTKTSDIEDIKQFAKKDQKYLKAQIELINPDIICCCGVFGSVEHYWPDIKKVGHRLHETSNYMVIDYWHPATRWPQDLFFYGLNGIVHQ